MKYSKRRRAAACSGSDGEDEILPSQHRKRAIDAMEGRLANLAGEVSALQSALEDLRKRHVELAAEGDILSAQLQGLPQDGSFANTAPDAQALGSGSTRGSDPGSTFHFSMFNTGEPASPGGHASAERRRASTSKLSQQPPQVPTDTRSTDEHQDHLTQIGQPLAVDPWDEIMMPNYHDECTEPDLAMTEGVLPFAAAGSTTGSPAAGVNAGATAPASAGGSGGPLAVPPAAANAPVGTGFGALAGAQSQASSRVPEGRSPLLQVSAGPMAASGACRLSEEGLRGLGSQPRTAGSAAAAFDPSGSAPDASETQPSDLLWWNSLLPSPPLQAEMTLPHLEPYATQQQQHPASPTQLFYTSQHGPAAVALPPPAVLGPAAVGSLRLSGGVTVRQRQAQHQLRLSQHQQIQPPLSQQQQQQQDPPALAAEAPPRRRGRSWPQLPPGDLSGGVSADDGEGVGGGTGGEAPPRIDAGPFQGAGLSVPITGSTSSQVPGAALAFGSRGGLPCGARDRGDGSRDGAAAAAIAAAAPIGDPMGLSLAAGGYGSPGTRSVRARGWGYGLGRAGSGGGGPAAAAAALLQDAGMVPCGGASLVGMGASGGAGMGMGVVAALLSPSPSVESPTALQGAQRLRRQLQQKLTLPMQQQQQLQQQQQQLLQEQQQQQQQPTTTAVLVKPELPTDLARPYAAVGIRRTWTSDGGGCGSGGGKPSSVLLMPEDGPVSAMKGAGGRSSTGGAAGPVGAVIGSPFEGGGDSSGGVQAHLHSGPWAAGVDAAGQATAPARSSSSPGAAPACVGALPPPAAAAATIAAVSAGPSSPPVTPRAARGLASQGSGVFELQPPHGPTGFPRTGSDGGAAGPAASGLPLPVPSPGALPYSPAWTVPYGPAGTYGPPYGGPYPVPVRYVGSPSRPVVWRRMQGRPPPPSPLPLMPPLPMPGQGGLPAAPLPPPGAAFGSSPGGNLPQGQLPPPGMLASPLQPDAV